MSKDTVLKSTFTKLSVQGKTKKSPKQQYRGKKLLMGIYVQVDYLRLQTWAFRFSVYNPAKSENDGSLILLHYLDTDACREPKTGGERHQKTSNLRKNC